MERETAFWQQPVGAHQRLLFLNEAGRLLSESLEPEDVVRRVALLAVPKVADWCLIDLVDEKGELRLAGVVDVDRRKETQLRALREKYPLEERHPIRLVVRSGKAQLVPRMAGSAPRPVSQLRLMRGLDSGAYVCVPLSAGGRVVGALSLGRSGVDLTEADLDLGRELGMLAGAAVFNARLYKRARDADHLLSQALAANNMVAWSWTRGSDRVERSSNAARIYGLDPGTELGRGFELLHPEDRGRYRAAVEKAVAERGSFRERFRMVRPDGTVAWMEEHGSMIGERLSAVVMDITARKLAEDEIRLQEEVSRVVAEAKGVAEAFPRLLAAIGKTLDWAGGLAWRMQDGGELAPCGRWGRPAEKRPSRRRHGGSQPGPLTREVLETGRASWVCGLKPDGRAGAARQTCSFAFPLLGASRRVLGVLEFNGDGTAVTESRRAELFSRLGRQIGAFLERKTAELALERQRREQQLILDAVPAMIWYKDARNVVLRVNRAAARWYGQPPERIEGRSAYELFPGRGGDYYRDDMAVIRTGRPRLGSVEEEVSPRGQRRWIRRDILPHRDADGRIRGVVIFAVDITEIKRAEAVLRESERAQRDFVANVSHEFRTPVAAIKGFAETLRRGGLEDGKNRLSFVRAIESHADRLDWLVQDLLDLAQLGSGMVRFKQTPIPARRFLTEYLESVAGVSGRRGVEVQVDVPEDLVLMADRPHLVQVLDNLLSNALKHSPKGSVVRFEARPEGRGARLTVRDQGCGIAAEHLPRLFDRFFRVAKGDGGGSTGLGLHIVKTIMEGQGGRVWVESEPGKGSAFHLALARAG